MDDDEIGSTTISKSVRSLLEAFNSFEREALVMLERMGTASPRRVVSRLRGLVLAVVRDGGLSDATETMRGLASLGRLVSYLGLADGHALEALKTEVVNVMTEVGQLKERERLLAGSLGQMRARAARFESALEGVARQQGRSRARVEAASKRSATLVAHSLERFEHALEGLARLQGRSAQRMRQAEWATEKVETLSRRRDEHITRLIRDTTVQRSHLERLSEEVAHLAQPDRGDETQRAAEELSAIRERVQQVETSFHDLRRLNKEGSQGAMHGLEVIRERLARLEARTAEISREARAKSGRLDALSRHVATVEGRLSSAIGKATETVVGVPQSVDQPARASQ